MDQLECNNEIKRCTVCLFYEVFLSNDINFRFLGKMYENVKILSREEFNEFVQDIFDKRFENYHETSLLDTLRHFNNIFTLVDNSSLGSEDYYDNIHHFFETIYDSEWFEEMISYYNV
jgi:hypothetical protein